MAIEAQLADGRILEFPDGTDPSVVQATVKRVIAQSAPPVETTAFGQVKEAFKGLVPGAVGLLESAATGASALLPEDMEKSAREKIKSVATAAKEPFAAAPGYEDSVARKLSEAVGSTAPFLLAGPLGLAGRAAAIGLGVGAGAGEARTRAEAEGATDEQRSKATAYGILPGAAEAFAPFRILSRVPTASKAAGVEVVKRALLAGGEEAAQEAASGFAQNLIAKGIYKPEQELIDGLGEQAAYGGATGAIVQGLMDLALGRRAKGAPTPPPAPKPEPGPQIAPEAPAEKPLLLGADKPFVPRALPDGSVATTQAELNAYEEKKFTDKYAPQPVREPKQLTLPGMEGLPPSEPTDLFGKPLPRAEDDAAPRTSDLMEGVPLTTDVLRDAGMAPSPKEAVEAGQQPLGLRRTPEGKPTTSGQPEPTFTSEDVMMTAVPVRKGMESWIDKNVIGSTRTQLLALIERDPTLIEGSDQRAKLLRALTAPEVPAFKEKPSVPTPTQANKPKPVNQPRGSQPSVGVSGQPASPNVVQPGAGVPTTATTPAAPVGLGLVPTGQPAGTGTPVAGTAKPALTPKPTQMHPRMAERIDAVEEKEEEREQAEYAAQRADMVAAFKEKHDRNVKAAWAAVQRARQALKTNTPQSSIAANDIDSALYALEDAAQRYDRFINDTSVSQKALGSLEATVSEIPRRIADLDSGISAIKPTKAAKPTVAKTPKAPAPAVETETVKSRYERLLDIANNEAIPAATRKQAEKQMDLLDDPTMNKSKDDRKGNEDYADRFLARVEGLRSVATAEGQSLTSLKDEIKNAKGTLGNALRRMVASGKVVLEEAHPSGKKIGGIYNGKNVTLYANGIPSGSSMAVALHEVGAHLGMERLLGKKQYNAVIDRILDMVAKADGSTEAKIAQAAYKRIPVSDFKRGVGRDEMVAYFVEEMAKSEAAGTLPKVGPLRNLWNQIKTAIVTSINKSLGTNFGVKDFSAQDILDIAKSSFVAESKTDVTEGKTVDMASTSQFQKWFGDSKVVDKAGKPLVLYTGTSKDVDFSKFKIPTNGAWFTTDPAVASQYALENDSKNLKYDPDTRNYREVNTASRVMPVYVRIENPYTLTKEERDTLFKASNYKRAQGVVFDRAKAKGYDGVNMGDGVWVVIKNANQIKSAIGNRGTYDIDNPNILFSTSYTAQDVVDAKGPLTPVNKRGLKEMIVGVEKEGDPTKGVKFRVAAVDSAAAIEEKFSRTFNGAVRDNLGKLNPMGLYRQAQDYSKILLEYFQKGTLTKDKETGLYRAIGSADGAPADVFPLIYAWGKKTGRTDKEAEQFASRVLEAKRLDEVLKINPDFPSHLTPHEIAPLVADYNSDPAFAKMNAAMDKPRIAMIEKMVDVGRLSKEKAEEWKSVVGYVPFDRIDDFTEKFSTIKKTTGRSPLALTKDPELVGSFKRPVGNVFENYLNTMGWMVGQVMNNDARVQTLRGLEDLGFTSSASRVPGTEGKTAKAYIKGEAMYWELPSRYDVAAFQDLNPPKMAFMRTLGAFSNILRKSVTLLPPFALKQVTDDVQRAMLTSGVKNPGALLRMSLANFGKLAVAELRGIQHPIVKEFGALGLTGEYDFEAGKPAVSLLKDLGYREREVAGSKTLGAIMHRLDGITRASDLAVRKAIYDQTLKESNNDILLAQTRAREFINFRRRGASEIIAVATATIPFFNAYAQGMDVLYRAASGKDSSSSVGRAQARQLFWSRAGTVAALSTMYALIAGDDEDYQDMDLRTRNGNWILPGGYKIPVPGELGAIFKVIPETVIEYLRRSGTPEEQTALEAIRASAKYIAEQYIERTVPIPQAVKPLIEAWTNYSTFTGRELEGIYQKQQDPSMRVTSKTSELAQAISNFSRDVIGVDAVSPIQIDNMLNGYFGSTAALVTMMTDSLLNPSRIDRPLHKYALLSNYLYDPIGTRSLTEFYDEREKVGKANNTLRQLMKTDIARAETYANAHQEELAMEHSINSTLEQLERTRAYRKFLNSVDGAKEMPKAEREKELEEIKRMEVDLTRWVREAKTELRKVQ